MAKKATAAETAEKTEKVEKDETINVAETENNSTDAERQANEYNPFTENVEDKGYNKASPIITGIKNEDFEIPEFVPERKVVDVTGGGASNNDTDNDPGKKESGKSESAKPNPTPSTGGGSSAVKDNPSIVPPSVDDMGGKSSINSTYGSSSFSGDKPTSKKDAKSNAERLADVALSGYAQLHTFAYMGYSLTTDKLQRRAAKGKFDMDALEIPIPISATEEITVLDYLSDYDRDLRRILEIEDDNRCYLSREFVENVRPALIEIFMRKGIGMTPEQKILYYVGMDVVSKGTQLIAMRVGMNQILKGVSEMQRKMNADNGINRPIGIPNYAREKRNMKRQQTQQHPNNQYIETPPQKPDVPLQETFAPEQPETEEPEMNHNPVTENETTQQAAPAAVPSYQNAMGETLGSSNVPNDPIDYSKIRPLDTKPDLMRKRGRKPGSRDSKPRSNKPYMKSNKKGALTRKAKQQQASQQPEEPKKATPAAKPEKKVTTPPPVVKESEFEMMNEA